MHRVFIVTAQQQKAYELAANGIRIRTLGWRLVATGDIYAFNLVWSVAADLVGVTFGGRFEKLFFGGLQGAEIWKRPAERSLRPRQRYPLPPRVRPFRHRPIHSQNIAVARRLRRHGTVTNAKAPVCNAVHRHNPAKSSIIDI